MFQAMILPIFRSNRLCFQPVGWQRSSSVARLPTDIVGALYHKLKTRSIAPEDGRNYHPKHVELIGIINKPLSLHVAGCLYYLYQ